MKKALCFLLLATVLFSFAACSGAASKPDSESTANTAKTFSADFSAVIEKIDDCGSKYNAVYHL